MNLHEPVEALALEPLPHGLLLGQVALVRAAHAGSTFVEMLLVLVHPDLGHPLVVARDEVSHARVGEGDVLAAIDVPHPTTRRVHHLPVTLPHLQ